MDRAGLFESLELESQLKHCACQSRLVLFATNISPFELEFLPCFENFLAGKAHVKKITNQPTYVLSHLKTG